MKPFLTNTAAIKGLVVNNNYFGANDSSVAIFTLQLGAKCLFDGNFGSGIVLQGNISDFIFSNNTFGDSSTYKISIQAPINSFSITGNIGRFEIAGIATDGAYSFNKGNFVTTPALALYRHENVLFTGNSLSDSSDITGLSV